MKKRNIFLSLFCSFFSLVSCYKPVKKEPKEEEDYYHNGNIIEPSKQLNNEPVLTESNPLFFSYDYHDGFYVRKHSSFYPYDPIVRDKLPKLSIVTENGTNEFATRAYNRYSKPNIAYEISHASLSNCEDMYAFDDISCSIKPRGNASLMTAKKSFALKFDNKQNMLGLNNNSKFKRWVLNPINELSRLRDFVAFYLGKQVFNSDRIFSSDCTFVDLYLNNEYWGMYLLTEKNQINKNRLNIDDVEKREPIGNYRGTDIGYLFEYDGYVPVESNISGYYSFQISYCNNAPLKSLLGETIYQANNIYLHSGVIHNDFSIASDIYHPNQKYFLQGYVDKTYNLIYNAAYNKKFYKFDDTYSKLIETPNSTSYEVISKAINVESFVNMYLLQEIFKNYDIYWGSQYLCVDMSEKGDKKLSWCCIWDNDNAFGNVKSLPFITPTGLYCSVSQNDINRNNAWYFLLIHEKWFMDLVKAKWMDLIKNQVLYNSLHYIDEMTINYKDEFENNNTRWNIATPQSDESQYLFEWLVKRYNSLNMFFGDKTKLFYI